MTSHDFPLIYKMVELLMDASLSQYKISGKSTDRWQRSHKTKSEIAKEKYWCKVSLIWSLEHIKPAFICGVMITNSLAYIIKFIGSIIGSNVYSKNVFSAIPSLSSNLYFIIRFNDFL